MAEIASNIDYDALVQEDRVHGSVYTESAIYEAEIEQIFHRGWVYIGHSSEIPEPGDFRVRPIGRQSAIMVRDDAGRVRVLMNRCSHRANAVCQVERGNARLFRCAYHGWTYHNDGVLAGVTYQDRYDESFHKEEFGLRKVPRMEIYRGFIFSSMSPVGITLDEHLGQAVTDQLDLFIDLSPEGELDVTAGVHKYGYHANWKFQIENGMDGYHPNFVHQTFFENVQLRTGAKLTAMFSSQSDGRTRDLGNGHVMLDFTNGPGQRLRASMPTTPWGREYARRWSPSMEPSEPIIF